MFRKVYLTVGTNKESYLLDDYRVLCGRDFNISGVDFEIYIIGESHFLRRKDGAYIEILSNKNMSYAEEFGDLSESSLSDFRRSFELKDMKISFTLEERILDRDLVPDFKRNSDILYTFASDDWALTAIVLPRKNNHVLETLHTYPEFNKMLITKTLFEKYESE